MRRFLTLLVVSLALVACSEKSAKPDYYVAAFIWPSCHDDAMAREHIWGDGEGVWEVIKRATLVSRDTTNQSNLFGVTRWTTTLQWSRSG